MRLELPDALEADDDLDLAVVLADLSVVVEVDVDEHERPVGLVGSDPADDLGHERGAPLLEELVVHATD